MSNAFNADLGTGQGRIQPAHWTAPDGEYVYVLGHDRPGVLRNVVVGDTHAIVQAFDPQTDELIFIRPRVHLRAPATMPAGTFWMLTFSFDGVPLYVLRIDAGDRERTRSDLALRVVQGWGGSADFEIKLELEGTAGSYDTELPGIYVDAVVGDTSQVIPVLAMRDPEPLERDVPADTEVRLTVFDPVSAGVSAVLVYIDGELIVTANDAEIVTTAPGYSAQFEFEFGAEAFPSPTISIQPDDPFASSATVTIRVVAAAQGGETLDQSYTFQIADTLAPAIESVVAISETEVRVIFTEDVLQVDAAGAGDALNPTNYVLELTGGLPAVLPAVLSVVSFAGNAVVLELDKMMTRGASYLLTVSDVEDIAGNPIAPEGFALGFVGYTCDVPAGRDVDLYRRFPEVNRIEDTSRDLWNVVAVLQEVIDLLFCLADRWTEILDPDTAPEPWVDLMLEDMGNPFAFELSLLEKRRLVQLLLAIYKSKGTGPGIVNAARLFLGLEVTINVFAWSPVGIGDAIIEQTWILGSSEPSDLYTFEVIVTVFLTDTERARLNAIVDYMKVAHEHHVIIEPIPDPDPPDHWQLGFSQLGTQTFLH